MKKIAYMLILTVMMAMMVSATPKVPQQGSYIAVNVYDEDTGERLSNFTLKVSIEYPGKYSEYSNSYEQKYYNGESRIGFSMPPSSYNAVAKISVTSDGYGTSDEQTMTSGQYWSNLGKDHIAEYEFKIKKQTQGICCIPLLPLLLALLSAVVARI